jgi:hypothetical protein
MPKNQELLDYYLNQAGSGIVGYSGVRFQRGNGWFSRILSNTIIPIGKFLGKKALKTGMNIGSDLLKGENLKSSIKNQLKSTGMEVAEEALDKIRRFRQTGTGKSKRRRKSRKKSYKKSSKKSKPSLAQLRALAKGRKSLKLKRIDKRRNIFKSSSLF